MTIRNLKKFRNLIEFMNGVTGLEITHKQTTLNHTPATSVKATTIMRRYSEKNEPMTIEEEGTLFQLYDAWIYYTVLEDIEVDDSRDEN
jgi:hypothetical protein